MMPASVVDNLLAIGYMIPGVANVTLEIDQIKQVIDYEVKLDPTCYKRYQLINRLSAGGIFKKVLALVLVSKFNYPKPNIYPEFIQSNVGVYLPKFKVNINVGR